MSIVKGSRYLLTDVIQITDPVTGQLVRPEYVDIRPRVTTFGADDRFLPVGRGTRWAGLGVGALGDARAWWVIADLSNVVDPFSELTVGGTLRAPSVQRYLFQIQAPNQTTT